MQWGLVEVHDEDETLREVHCLPFAENPTASEGSLLWWHTTSALCGCNPRMERRPDGVKLYTHHERADDDSGDADHSA